MRTIYIVTILLVLFGFAVVSCENNQQAENVTGTNADSTELQKLSKRIANSPDDAEAYYGRALIYYNEENFGDAIFDLAAAMKIDSINEKYYHLLADSYLGALKSEYALLVMDRALRLFPESMPTLLKAAELQIVLKRYEQASASLKKALELESRNTEALYLLGIMLYEQGNLERAAQSFQTVVEIDSENKEAWTMLGNLYDLQGDTLALQCFENAISIDPDYLPGWHSKAYYLQNHDRIDEAISIYQQIHEMDSAYVDAYLNAGILFLEKNVLDSANAEFEKLAQLQPINPLGPYYLGLVNEKQGNFDEALGFFNQASALSPGDKRFAEAVERTRNRLEN